MVDEVTQLLSNKNLKESLGKNKLELSKLLKELNVGPKAFHPSFDDD